MTAESMWPADVPGQSRKDNTLGVRSTRGTLGDTAASYAISDGATKGSGPPAMNRSKQAGMAIKAIVVLLAGLAVASIHPTDAQQTKKVPLIGYLSSLDAASVVSHN